jgi:hypothetical protein
MKRMLAALVLTSAAGCGGSDGTGGSSTKDLANFLGATWNGTTTVTVTCPGSAPNTQGAAFALAFTAGTDADFQYTSQGGCFYKYNVSGNTASLSNAPVSCTTTANGTTVTTTWSSYTLTTSDGHSLSINTAGTGTALGQTCPFTQTGTAAR